MLVGRDSNPDKGMSGKKLDLRGAFSSFMQGAPKGHEGLLEIDDPTFPLMSSGEPPDEPATEKDEGTRSEPRHPL